MSNSVSKTTSLLFSLFILGVVVFPNALRLPKLLLLIPVAFICLSLIRKIDREAIYVLGGGILVTIIYLAKGAQLHVDPTELYKQIFAAYIVAPIFWIVFANYCLIKFPTSFITNTILIGGAAACFVTFLCFWLYEQGYYDAYILINGSDKINAVRGEDGYGIILNLFGSLIFISAAVVSLYTYKITIQTLLLTLLLLTVAFISGRTALLLSFFIGGILLFAALTHTNKKNKNLLYAAIALPIAALCLISLSIYYNVDLGDILTRSWDEIISGGGGIRSVQISHLIDGIADTYLFGAGHGANVVNIRFKLDRPWEYEVLFLATVFRVGFIGTLIYALPFILNVKRYFSLFRSKNANKHDHFFFFGFMAMSVGIFTNAYFESIEFQWTYFLPYIYFLKRTKQIINGR